jgi:exonuclease SbcC
LRVAGALAAALVKARAEQETQLRAHQEAQKQAHATSEQAAVDARAAKGATQEAVRAEAAHAKRTAAWQEARTSAGFADTATWQSACLTAEATAELERQITSHEQALAAAKDRDARARAEAGDVKVPDLETLQTTWEASAATLRTTRDRATRLERDVQEALRLRQEVDADLAICTELEKRFGVFGKLAQVADGGNPQRLSFQRFVLASRLDEVLEVASVQLAQMTGGRYRLRRREGIDDKRSAGGLEIDVDDNETGRPRPARTLSGGEGFLAALALSLATAEVVTHHAGGIRLDSIFVDEGFGTLDDESLDRALGTLIQLHEGGRLVGVISHVAELRERIDVRLEVTKTGEGSRARFILP